MQYPPECAILLHDHYTYLSEIEPVPSFKLLIKYFSESYLHPKWCNLTLINVCSCMFFYFGVQDFLFKLRDPFGRTIRLMHFIFKNLFLYSFSSETASVWEVSNLFKLLHYTRKHFFLCHYRREDKLYFLCGNRSSFTQYTLLNFWRLRILVLCDRILFETKQQLDGLMKTISRNAGADSVCVGYWPN